ncbi:hypothetical protein C922_05731 [Plasmodium inui San Antonio 1]|uniref:Uncharacterized protein n=1 Tax=Plasmodium inui San Antonio 1 TaxID=1237626 RepID=W6ZSJ7_9APIC|nr:hypothetical protein C922_05731 [Plasmodium inui San Antonio 1]EUD63887.1 hypothetical protein C922_05731 [Plasmodium inui San Antonio 1]
MNPTSDFSRSIKGRTRNEMVEVKPQISLRRVRVNSKVRTKGEGTISHNQTTLTDSRLMRSQNSQNPKSPYPRLTKWRAAQVNTCNSKPRVKNETKEGNLAKSSSLYEDDMTRSHQARTEQRTRKLAEDRTNGFKYISKRQQNTGRQLDPQNLPRLRDATRCKNPRGRGGGGEMGDKQIPKARLFSLRGGQWNGSVGQRYPSLSLKPQTWDLQPRVITPAISREVSSESERFSREEQEHLKNIPTANRSQRIRSRDGKRTRQISQGTPRFGYIRIDNPVKQPHPSTDQNHQGPALWRVTNAQIDCRERHRPCSVDQRLERGRIGEPLRTSLRNKLK